MENLTRRRSKKRNFPNDSPRLSDWRQESIVLVSTDILFNSDYVPVSLGLYCRNKKFEEPSIVELKDFIQKASSQCGSRFRTTNKISHPEAMNNHLAALEEDSDCRVESVVFTSTIKSLASVLSSDFKAFQFQWAPRATHKSVIFVLYTETETLSLKFVFLYYYEILFFLLDFLNP